MADLSDADLARIRDEVGSKPDDDTIGDLWDELGNVPAVSLRILRPRLADALTAAAAGSVSIPGVISVGAPASPQYLRDQIARLESELATLTGDADDGLAGVGRLTRRSQQRGIPFGI